MLRFKEISLKSKNRIMPYLNKYGENSCQACFAQMYLLKDKYRDMYDIRDNCLYIFRAGLSTPETKVYLFPLCEEKYLDQAIKNVIDAADAELAKPQFFTITEKQADYLEAHFPGVFTIEEDRNCAEYIYSSEKLSTLSGKKLAAKRNHINGFNRDFGEVARLESFGLFGTGDTPKLIEQVSHFQTAWLSSRDKAEMFYQLQAEDRHIREALRRYEELDLHGVALFVNDVLVGYSFGVPISDTCIDVIAEKGDISIPGIYQVINNEFAKSVREHFQYVNREEDLGIPGLRKAKESYYPDNLLKKYVATAN